MGLPLSWILNLVLVGLVVWLVMHPGISNDDFKIKVDAVKTKAEAECGNHRMMLAGFRPVTMDVWTVTCFTQSPFKTYDYTISD